jgi:large subunit ribosomal protein L10
VKKEDKQRVVSELSDRLKSSETLLVADYRGLTMPQIDELRSRLLEHGARFSVVKNTLTRRAAEEAGADALLALLEGPTAIAFLEAGRDPVAVAKALRDVARDTRVLAIRGGVLEGRAVTAEEVESLATLPPADVLRAQVLGTIAAPLITIVGLFTAPLRDLVGVIDARIEQLKEQGDTSGAVEPEAQGGGAVEEEREEGGEPMGEPVEASPPDETQEEDTQNAPEEEGES